MTRTKRLGLIKKIEEKRGSRVLAYFTGDRRGLATKISTEIFPMVHSHLSKFGNQDKIDLYIYSTGGITIAGFALVNLIREFCKEFNTIIPFRALSTATLISLGANEIVMTKLGQLGPIDPSIEHALGPIANIPGRQAGLTTVNVEDVNAFFELAREEVGLKSEESMHGVFQTLANSVNPLVLGAVQRSREQIAFLAQMLMKHHIEDEEQIDRIIKTLIRQRFSHDYIIGRREAKEDLKLNIVEPDQALNKLILELFYAYNNLLEMETPYSQEVILGQENEKVEIFNRAMIESFDLTHVFRTEINIKRAQVQQPGTQVPVEGFQEKILQEGWLENSDI